jgi:hypothetical protein
MKIICSEEEAKILITNCNQEQCEFCFLYTCCRLDGNRGSIMSLIEIEKPELIQMPEGWERVSADKIPFTQNKSQWRERYAKNL